MVLYFEYTAFLWSGIFSGLTLIIILLRVTVNAGKQSDTTLIQHAKKGDTQAFDQLVERYQQQIYYGVIRIVLNHEDANDVIQDAFIKAYRNLERFDENYRFYTWIYRIAINTALNLVQQRKHKEQYVEHRDEDNRFDPPDDADPTEAYEQRELKEHVLSALNHLSSDKRSVFVMRVHDELSYKEIAEILDISIGTVMSRLNRARTMLRQYLVKNNVIQDNE